MNPVREQTEYAMTRGLFALLRICPEGVVYGLCRGFASAMYRFATSRRRITLKNLQLAFPETNEVEREQIARAAYDHFGQMIAESAMILAGKIDQQKLFEMVDGEQMQKLLDLEQNNPKGILFITGHLGNFEIMSHYMGSRFKRQGHVVARRGNNRLIDDKIVVPMRESFGNKVVYKNRALPHVARALRKGEHAGLLIDIRTNVRQGVPVTFFGHPTHAIPSSAYLQMKLDVPVVPVALIRTTPRRYKLVVGEPLEKPDAEMSDEVVKTLTQQHQNALEAMIREFPDQWFWMHDRWKR